MFVCFYHLQSQFATKSECLQAHRLTVDSTPNTSGMFVAQDNSKILSTCILASMSVSVLELRNT